MSGYEMVEEDELNADLLRLFGGTALLVGGIVATGWALGAVFEVVYLNASPWPVPGWFALAHILAAGARSCGRALRLPTPPRAPQEGTK